MRGMRGASALLLGFAAIGWAGAADAAELDIINASLKGIQHLYIAPSGDKDWGRDLLAGPTAGTIAPGDHRVFADLKPATYDLRLIDDEGAECEIDAIEVDTMVKVELGDTQLADCATSN
jgi:hypothetical protein